MLRRLGTLKKNLSASFPVTLARPVPVVLAIGFGEAHFLVEFTQEPVEKPGLVARRGILPQGEAQQRRRSGP